MVKAKEMKLMRKALDHFHKSTIDPLDEVLQDQQQIETQTSDDEQQVNNIVDSNDSALTRHPKFRIFATAAKPTNDNDRGTVMKMNGTTTNNSNGDVPNKPLLADDKVTEQLSISSPLLGLSSTPAVDEYTVRYYRSATLPNHLNDQCIQLFAANMKELYEKSSWGYNIDTKQQELQHPHARFIIITAPTTSTCFDKTASTSGNDDDDDDSNRSKETVVAFVHYRHCYDDEDDPTMIVLYIYEMQVHHRYQKQGIGQYCMALIETIATKQEEKQIAAATTVTKSKENNVTTNTNSSKSNKNKSSGSNKKKTTTSTSSAAAIIDTSTARTVQKIMLTVFRKNIAAMQMYRTKLQYGIDPSSPSQHNQITDYEILSKSVSATGSRCE